MIKPPGDTMPANNRQALQPSSWVVGHAKRIPTDGRVLDLACGSGRHARWLRRQGHTIVAADIKLDGVADLRDQDGIELLETDLEQDNWTLEGQLFAGIVVTNYLYRPHLPQLIENLQRPGILIYETFAAGNEQYGKPSNPDFLLQPGELLKVFGNDLRVIAFEQGLVEEESPKIMQRLCATYDH
jgi:SAM-dependent methyltransferase